MPGKDWHEKAPKVELHVHLEGAIPLPTLWELVQKYGGDKSVPTLDSLQERFRYQDFAQFIQTWIWKNRFLREYDDFTFVAEAVASDLAAQNIVYAEAFYSPPDFLRRGLKTQELTAAIRRGLNKVRTTEIALVADLVRDEGASCGAATLHELRDVREFGVVGIGLGGSEHAHPPEDYRQVYEQARAFGFRTSAHAGEAAGAQSIWGAIHALKVDRIGHGTRAYEDAKLLEYLAEKRIPLEVCPVSNLRTGVVARIEDHPIRDYFNRGIIVTVNTDDPKMFGNSLAEEYRLLETHLGFSRHEVCQLMIAAIQSAWLPAYRKQELLARTLIS
jgi:adenosine deaminase